jgi:hypothetical protein
MSIYFFLIVVKIDAKEPTTEEAKKKEKEAETGRRHRTPTTQRLQGAVVRVMKARATVSGGGATGSGLLKVSSKKIKGVLFNNSSS